MSFRIVVDSCCELPEQFKNDERFISVPLELQVGDYRIKDDENFDQLDFIKRVAECETCARSACPDPETYMDAYSKPAERVYVITLSSHLSGSYNSALLASRLYEEEMAEEFGPRQIHVIDSESASVGETQIALKLLELEESGRTFEEIVDAIEQFRDNVKTYFVIDNLDTFIKNGRISGLKAAVATTLNIKPILIGVKGEIEQIGQALGMRKALNQMANVIRTKHAGEKYRHIIISNCNCPETADKVKAMLSDLTDNEIMILPMAGVSTMYANDGGIIVTL